MLHCYVEEEGLLSLAFYIIVRSGVRPPFDVLPSALVDADPPCSATRGIRFRVLRRCDSHRYGALIMSLAPKVFVEDAGFV